MSATDTDQDRMKGLFGLLPTPYRTDLEIDTDDLRSLADFCCRSGQHGIVWPVMVGEFYFLGEAERIAALDEVLDVVDSRLPVVFGCSGVSVPQVLEFARAAGRAGADSVIAMAPSRTNQDVAIDMYHRLGDAFDGPIMVQNAGGYAPLTGTQIAQLVEKVPHIDYIKEERQPGPRHIAEVKEMVGDQVKTIFGGAGGRFLPDEMRRGADGCMPACEFGDILARFYDLWWAGDTDGARALHRRVLPLINLENHALFRHILQRRGVMKSTTERAPGPELDADDRAEISILLEALEEDDVCAEYPFGDG
ncbi:MAG: dihydrodipicolinate synthase family protein [Gemmatimonadetes bacterium]|nr:dihydrodipicolinate synthase family protein [Gemmatimonadota bacterium]MBT7864290.1 dihydrodipicolinate synthase family protein [Gemmatimonadota bacterium]